MEGERASQAEIPEKTQRMVGLKDGMSEESSPGPKAPLYEMGRLRKNGREIRVFFIFLTGKMEKLGKRKNVSYEHLKF